MLRQIHDEDYLNFLPTTLHKKRYSHWREQMLANIENIVATFHAQPRDEAIATCNLTPRDVALLVRLGYFTPEEAEAFNLYEIEKKVPE